jgi:hypothetical protein
MTVEPGTSPDATPAPDPAPRTPADALNLTVRRAAAQALEQAADQVDDATSLLAAITEQAHATGHAHGLAPGSWDHGRVEAMAILALFAATVTTAEATDALRKRLRRLGTHEVARHLAHAAEFLRP